MRKHDEIVGKVMGRQKRKKEKKWTGKWDRELFEAVKEK